MFALLKIIGKWGIKISLIVAIPMAYSDEKLKIHSDYTDVITNGIFSRLERIEKGDDSDRKLLLEQGKQINFLYRRELEKMRKEVSK